MFEDQRIKYNALYHNFVTYKPIHLQCPTMNVRFCTWGVRKRTSECAPYRGILAANLLQASLN